LPEAPLIAESRRIGFAGLLNAATGKKPALIRIAPVPRVYSQAPQHRIRIPSASPFLIGVNILMIGRIGYEIQACRLLSCLKLPTLFTRTYAACARKTSILGQNEKFFLEIDCGNYGNGSRLVPAT
jgi:hypothetical protein